MQALSIAEHTNLSRAASRQYAHTKIRVHLMLTWLRLICHPKTLTSARRRSTLRSLRHYWVRGTFPQNVSYAATTPIFRDHNGTLCAMGYLAYADGQGGLVDEIVSQNNLVNLTTQSHVQFASWLATTGLSDADAAHIQPSYHYDEPLYTPSTTVEGSSIVPIVLALLLVLPFYVSAIGTYMIVGKSMLEDGSRAKKLFRLSVILAIIFTVAAIALAIALLLTTKIGVSY